MSDNEKYIRKRFDVDGLFEAGFLKNKTDFKYIEQRIITFFGLENIYQYERIGNTFNKVKAKNIFSEN